MNNYGNLIKSNIISFNDALISNFKSLEIDEIDVILLIVLNNQLKDNNPYLSLEFLENKLTIKQKDITKRIMKLLQIEYIELIQNEKSEEVFTLDGIYNELGSLLEGNESRLYTDQELIKKIVNLVEVSYQKELSYNDLDYINNWVSEKYSFDVIKDAVLTSVRMNKMNLSYVDRVLATSVKIESHVEVDEKTRQLLKGINVRK